MIRLMIADDHAIMREGLKQLFSLADDLRVVADAENGSIALERLRQGDIDLLLLGINMPGLSGETCCFASTPTICNCRFWC